MLQRQGLRSSPDPRGTQLADRPRSFPVPEDATAHDDEAHEPYRQQGREEQEPQLGVHGREYGALVP
jgi:hypothetical protein